MIDEKKEPVSKIVGKIELKDKPPRKNHDIPLRLSLGDVLKQAIEKAKKNAS